jgi:hypothetical protein
MLGVIPAGHAVAIFEYALAVGRHQHRTKRFVSGGQRLRRQLHAAPQMCAILFSDHQVLSNWIYLF